MDTNSPPIHLFRDDAPPTATDLQSLLHRMIGLAEEGEPLRIAIEYRGQHVELTVGPMQAPVGASDGTTDAGDAKLTYTDRTILQAVAELPESPTGAEIADKAGFPYAPYLKMRLSNLRRAGFLGGAKGQAGYPQRSWRVGALDGAKKAGQ